ncbi:hypothetical protein [Streptomyces iconiensis]|uniref:Uncharacterized protein n=1 Tax=Streptomyces iconiensis TaxID=1384038 RepID=A0ABT6ZRV0_9ACTN|nr:hypothetical protein [Streptomyces iconiensis]MDJ1131233.1 hypothetical protein [Streptomyces iconiensis]
MAKVTVYPPDTEGGRRVRVDGRILGRAFNVYDVLEMLEPVGLDPATAALDDPDLFDWRGGGAADWTPRPDDEGA